ncbi:DUF1127 domain-containing protein [Puniceibacterium confluentis]|uniref:DUF1127 domain-containing protein n=1 Tax=Puniceibacterium confluentis TaxID=1958944 RepID=UPI0011B7A653|nr:DUF1127 domain-containing protein [Puniceibacterium confluentis]
MAHLNTVSAPFRPVHFATLHSARAVLSGLWQRNSLVRKTERELSALSDRNLADLGISRSGIPALARKTVQQSGF